MKFLLDTNVISELHKPQGNAAVRARMAKLNDEDVHLSVISLGEIANGISSLHLGKKRLRLEEWFAQIEKYFGDRVLPVDRHIAQLWGELTAKAAAKGKTLHAADGLIAATAIHHGLRLVTRNTSDFDPTGALLLNPWES